MSDQSGRRTPSGLGLRALKGATAFLFAVSLMAATIPMQAQTYNILYNFGGGGDGGDPYASLMRDAAGNLYSTAGYGGTDFAGGVFKVDAKGNETMLYSFTGGTDGAYPMSAVVKDKKGNLYGTTTQGGSAGAGVVFKVDPTGKETVLHNFTGGADGADPVGGLYLDKFGNLYGTTSQGGTSDFGILFKLSPKGKETILHSFTGASNDGRYPTYTSVLMDEQENIYGVTEEGGSTGGGILYKLTKSGKFSILHSFAGGTADGCNVLGVPIRDKQGNFFGTTSSCGTSGFGTLWKVTKNGKESVLHNFAGGPSDGQYPLAGVIEDASGNLYGNTETGGSDNVGTVYKLSKTGEYKLVHSFDGSDGKFPYGSFAQDSKGTIYGTTQNGGSIGYGTVWEITK